MIDFNKYPTIYIIFAIITISGARTVHSDWYSGDGYDEIKTKFDKVTAENCADLPVDDLYLSNDAVSHIPDIREFNINPILRNRTELVLIHNMALSRSFFWSFTFQSRLMSSSNAETYDPNMLYYFLSTAADVSASSGIDASAIYFSPNTAYTSTYDGLFNKTFPRFAPRTLRLDDLSTTFDVQDLGILSEDLSKDYTSDVYKINEWHRLWLPDLSHKQGNYYNTKTTYKVDIIYSNESFIIYGPPGADEIPGPVKFTRPYFDCGRSNKWLIAAVTPIADLYPRNIQSEELKDATYTAINVLEMEYDRIDINQCPKGSGNDGPNKFADTARCKKDTTECAPIDGWGLKRGGYQCRCKPHYRLPKNVNEPYQGKIADEASDEEYSNGFECLPTENIQSLPISWDKVSPDTRANILDAYPEYKNPITGPKALKEEKINIDEVLKFINSVTPNNCNSFDKEDLKLNYNISFGSEKYFENEAKMAVRLANFLSAYLQVSNENEHLLTENQIISEVLSIVQGNSRIWSAATYWDTNKFPNKTYFAPYAYKKELNTRTFKVDDLARTSNEIYTENPKFQSVKEHWSNNLDNLDEFHLNMKVRENANGDQEQKFEPYPTSYKAGNIDYGHWTTPEFKCDGHVKKWIITYAAPFFGLDSSKSNLEFKGAVAVSMDLLQLDINQCEDDVSNAFRNTHKCDVETTKCVPLLGEGFYTGGYKCECRQGFEYPFEDQITYYHGQLVEHDFEYLVEDEVTRYATFKCRAIESDL